MAAGAVILVVDDNETVRRFIASVLRPLGYRVETAGDGIEALQRIVQAPVDLILLDFVMPRMNGYHFCKALDERRLAEGVPVVLLSSTEERVAERMREHTRVVDFLAKPVRAGLLREAIARHLPPGRPAGDPAPAEDEESLEFDIPPDASPAGPAGRGAPGSSDDLHDPQDLLGRLRDLLQGALADRLAERIDQLADCHGREEMLGLIAEIAAAVVDDELLEEIVRRLRAPGG